MAKIRINPAGVMRASTMAESARRAVDSAASGINSIRWGLDSRILNRHNIGGRLNSVRGTVLQLAGDIQALSNAVNRGASQYNDTESRIVSMGCAVAGMSYGGGGGGMGDRGEADAVEETKAESLWKRFFDGDLEKKDSVSAWNNGLQEDEDGWHLSALNAGYSASVKPAFGSYEKDDVKEFKEKTKTKKIDVVYDPKTGQYVIPDCVKFPEKEITIAEVEAAASAEVSIFEAKLTGDKEYADYNIDAKVGVAEAHAKISAGIYTYDVNGVTLAAPAVDASVGASVSVISMTADGRVGLGEDHNMLGLYGEGSVDALKAGAEAKAGVSVFNDKGDLDLSAYAEASAEAIAVEAKGTLGISVLGADAGVTGSVNVGVGAHAKVGIVDGKVKVDVGASLGVGVSVGFEVDVGGMVNTVCGAAESAWKGIKSWFS